jgi:hypothetical protein
VQLALVAASKLPIGLIFFGALHEALAPPQTPVQDQDQGPVPLTADAVPALQSPVVGLVSNIPPFEVPHEAATAAVLLELQDAFVPPPAPLQVHVQGPVPLTAVAVPVLQNPVVGAVQAEPPLAEPQEPLTTGTGQFTVNGLVPQGKTGLVPPLALMP